MDNLTERDRDIFEAGYAACWAEMFAKSDEKPAFILSDAVFDRAWGIYLETRSDDTLPIAKDV